MRNKCQLTLKINLKIFIQKIIRMNTRNLIVQKKYHIKPIDWDWSETENISNFAKKIPLISK